MDPWIHSSHSLYVRFLLLHPLRPDPVRQMPNQRVCRVPDRRSRTFALWTIHHRSESGRKFCGFDLHDCDNFSELPENFVGFPCLWTYHVEYHLLRLYVEEVAGQSSVHHETEAKTCR